MYCLLAYVGLVDCMDVMFKYLFQIGRRPLINLCCVDGQSKHMSATALEASLVLQSHNIGGPLSR